MFAVIEVNNDSYVMSIMDAKYWRHIHGGFSVKVYYFYDNGKEAVLQKDGTFVFNTITQTFPTLEDALRYCDKKYGLEYYNCETMPAKSLGKIIKMYGNDVGRFVYKDEYGCCKILMDNGKWDQLLDMQAQIKLVK